MRELKTIQKQEKLNRIFAVDKGGPCTVGDYYIGANYQYIIIDNSKDSMTSPDRKVNMQINFQRGPRKEEKSMHGIIDSDLLEIVRDRLKSFQDGPYKTIENEHALRHIEEALMWMNRRVEDRIERNVLGTYNK